MLMYNLDAALEFANYQSTLNQQKEVLRQKFKDSCLMAKSGGLFLISPEFISGLTALDHQHSFVIDCNHTPVYIEDIPLFLAEAKSIYNQAVQDYGNEFSKLKTQRSVKSLVGL